jgi:putative protease
MMLRKSTVLHCKYRAEVSTAEQLTEALELSQLEYVYAPVSIGRENLAPTDVDRIIAVPPVFDGVNLDRFTHVLANTVGDFSEPSHKVVSIHGGLRLNVANSLALAEYEKLGLVDCILSIELSLQRMKSLKSTIPKGFIAYGRLPMMLLRRFPDCDGIIDRKEKLLPLVKTGNEAELLNPVPLILSDRMDEFADLDFAVLRLMPGESVREVLSMYENGIKPKGDFTRGRYYK